MMEAVKWLAKLVIKSEISGILYHYEGTKRI